MRPPKCFIPRREAAQAAPKGSNCFYLCFIVGVGNGAGGVRFAGGNPPKKKPENVLFTDRIDGWTGWDGMGGWGIKSVLQFSLYFVCI